MRNAALLFLILGVVISVLRAPPAFATPHNAIGPVYPIEERDLLEELQEGVANDAGLQAWRRWASDQVASLARQTPAEGLAQTGTVNLEKSLRCTGKVFNPLTDICWDCFLPVSIGSGSVAKSRHMLDTPNPKNGLCVCHHGIVPVPGVATGYWEPIALVDVVRTPFCMVSLGGITLPGHARQGTVTSSDGKERTSFFHVHVYRFPRIRWLSRAHDLSQTRGHLPLIYMSEFDPTWANEELAKTVFPETKLFGNNKVQLACGLDAVSASSGLAQDALFWCAGAQGAMYPLTGYVSAHVGGVQASVLLLERVLFKLHQSGVIKDSSPHHLCGEQYTAPLPKSRYRYQLVYPVPTTQKRGCQPVGRSTLFWEALYPAFEPPFSTENYAYLVWRKRNFCAY